jgi:hypothetical protein
LVALVALRPVRRPAQRPARRSRGEGGRGGGIIRASQGLATRKVPARAGRQSRSATLSTNAGGSGCAATSPPPSAAPRRRKLFANTKAWPRPTCPLARADRVAARLCPPRLVAAVALRPVRRLAQHPARRSLGGDGRGGGSCSRTPTRRRTAFTRIPLATQTGDGLLQAGNRCFTNGGRR